MKLLDRYRGCMLGLAVGDAVGTTLEFKKPGTFIPIDDMTGGGQFNLPPGQWTGAPAQTLCPPRHRSPRRSPEKRALRSPGHRYHRHCDE